MKNRFLILFLLISSVGYAESITLQNGKVVEGKIISRNEDSLVVDFGHDIQLTYFLDDIATIDGEPLNKKSKVSPNLSRKKKNAGPETVLAVIPGTDERTPAPHLLAKLEVDLSNTEGLGLVERTQVDQILQEQSLSATGILDLQSAPQLGKLLAADMLLFFEKVPDSALSLFRGRIVESQTGVILRTVYLEEEALLGDLGPTISAVRESLASQNVPPEERRYLSIVGLQSEEPDSAMDKTADTLTMLLDSELSDIPEIFLLDREHLQHLQQEKELTDIELQLKASTFIVEGGIRRDEAKENWQITVFMRPLTSAQKNQYDLKVTINDYDLARKKLKELILKGLNVSGTSPKLGQTSLKEEAKLFLDKVPVLISSGDFQEAIRFAEAANALDESPQTHAWAAQANYLYGWKLADYFKSNNWHIDPALADSFTVEVAKRHRHIPGVTQTTSQSTTVTYASPGEGLKNQVRDTYNSGAAQPGTQTLYKLNSGTAPAYAPTDSPRKFESGLSDEIKIQALSSLQLAYRHVYAAIRQYEQASRATACRDFKYPDPLRYQVRLTLPQYGRSDGRAVAELYDHSDTFLNTYHAVLKAMDEVLVYRLKNSSRCYRESENVQEAYWSDWRERKEIIALYYNNSPGYLAPFYEELVASINSLPEINNNIGLLGLWDVLSPVRENRLNDVEVKAFQQLLKHKNPSLQLIAGYYLMTGSDKKYAKDVERVWGKLKEEKFYKEETMIRSAIERQRADQGSWTDTIVQFLDPKSKEKKENARKIQRATDTFTAGTSATPEKGGHEVIRSGQFPQDWGQFTIDSTAIRIHKLARNQPFDDPVYSEGTSITKDVFIEDGVLYAVGREIYPKRQFKDSQWKRYLYTYALDNKSVSLFELPVKGGVVTTLTTDSQNIYVGTSAGMVQFDKAAGREVKEEELAKGEVIDGVPVGREFNAANGFVDNQILSMAYYDGKIYVGTGPVKPESIGYMHRSAFSAYDPSKNTYALIASNRSVSKRSGLDGGVSYRILDLLADYSRECIWMAVTADEERSGLWKYDVKSGQLSQEVKEKLPVKKIYRMDDEILYLLNSSGWISFNPESGKKDWLISFKQNYFLGEGPFSPHDYAGKPREGYPSVTLWPFGSLNGALFTEDMQTRKLQMHKNGKTTLMTDEMANSTSLKYILGIVPGEQGLYVINGSGDVYLIR